MSKRRLASISCILILMIGILLFRHPLWQQIVSWSFQRYCMTALGTSLKFERAHLEEGAIVFERPLLLWSNSPNGEGLKVSAENMKVIYAVDLKERRLAIAINFSDPRVDAAELPDQLRKFVTQWPSSPPWITVHISCQVSHGTVTLRRQSPLNFEMDLSCSDKKRISLSGWVEEKGSGRNCFELNYVENEQGRSIAGVCHYLDCACIAPFLQECFSKLRNWKNPRGVINGAFSFEAPIVGAIRAQGELSLQDISGEYPPLDLKGSIERALVRFGSEPSEIAQILELKNAAIFSDSSAGIRTQIKDVSGSAALRSGGSLVFDLHGTGQHLSTLAEGNIQGQVALLDFSTDRSYCHGMIKGDEIEGTFFFDNDREKGKTKFECIACLSRLIPFLPEALVVPLQTCFSDEKIKIHAEGEPNGDFIRVAGEIGLEGSAIPFGFDLQHRDLDFVRGTHKGIIPIVNGTYFEKCTGLLFTDIKAKIQVGNSSVYIRDLEAFSHGIYFGGEIDLNWNQLDRDSLEIVMRAQAMHGKVSQLREIFSSYRQPLFFSNLPLEGNISLIKDGGIFRATFDSKSFDYQLLVNGALTEGILSFPDTDISVHDLSMNFLYDHGGDKLDFSDIQGGVLIGKPGHVDEYMMVGDRIRFLNREANGLEFDLWVGDRKRDIVRLVGKTLPPSIEHPGRIDFAFDLGLTHFGDVHPRAMELALLDWNQIESFKLSMQFRLNTLFRDLQRFSRTGLFFLSRSLLKEMNDAKNARGAMEVDLNYDKNGSQFNYVLSGEEVSVNKLSFKKFYLTGRKQDSAWSIDQLQMDDLSLSADITRLSDSWKINFLGFRYGESVLIGLEGMFFPDRDRIDADLNLLEIKLDHVGEVSFFKAFSDRFKPKGSLRAKGKIEVEFFKGVDWLNINAEIDAALKSVELQGWRLQDTEHVACQFSSGSGIVINNLKLDRPILLGGREFFLDEFSVKMSQRETVLETEYYLFNRPVEVKLRGNGSAMESGDLFISERGTTDPLVVQWEFFKGRGCVITKAEGHLSGLEFNLVSDSYRQTLSGDVSIDMHKAADLFPYEFSNKIREWGIGSGYVLNGSWYFNNQDSRLFSFQGKLTGEQFEFYSYQLQDLSAEVVYSDGILSVHDIALQDPAGVLKIPEMTVWYDEKGQLMLAMQKLGLKDFIPSLLHSAEIPAKDLQKALVIHQLDLKDLNGYFFEPESFSGSGDFQFTTMNKKETSHQIFIIPNEMISRLGLDVTVLNPAFGKIAYEIRDSRIFLTSFKDVYSEGKLSKFYLPKHPDASYIDFNGNMHLQFRMKQYNLLFKLAELFTLTIEGPFQKPVYSLQRHGENVSEASH